MESISLVMPTHGPLGNSRAALVALRRLSPPPDELIIIVDAPMAPADSALLPPSAKVVQVPFRSGPAIARDHGAKASSSHVLLFVDSDVVIPPDTIGRVQSLFDAAPSLSAVFGSYDASPGDPGFLSQYRNLLHHYVHQQGNPNATTFWAGLGAIRSHAFHAMGGFNTAYAVPSIEDIELGLRMSASGHEIRLVKDLQGQHLKRWTISSMLRTDLFCRGIPWTRLILSRHFLTNDLSLDLTARLSTLACAVAILSLAAALLSPQFLFATISSITFLILINRHFYSFLARSRGPWFALKAIPWHAVFYIECGLAAIAGAGLHYCSRILRNRPTHA